MNGVAKAARIQLVHWRAMLLIPWAVLTASFLINIAIFAALGDSTPPSHRTTGGLSSIYGTMLFVHMATVTQVFPFSVAMSVTRRAFLAATALIVTGQALLNGVLLTVLKGIETATGGWGLKLRFFNLPYVTQHNPLTQMLVYTVPFLVVPLIGICVGAVFHRWGVLGVWTTVISTLLVVGLTGAAVIFFKAAHSIGSFVTGQPAFAVLALYPLILVALTGTAASRMILRSRM